MASQGTGISITRQCHRGVTAIAFREDMRCGYAPPSGSAWPAKNPFSLASSGRGHFCVDSHRATIFFNSSGVRDA